MVRFSAFRKKPSVQSAHLPDLLPRRRSTLKVTEGLGQLDGLDDNTFLLIIISDLDVASQGEIFPHGMTLESVIGQDTSQIGMSSEEDSVHVPSLTLEPVDRVEQSSEGGDGGDLVGVGLDADTAVEANRQAVVDNLETVGARRIIDSAHIHDLLELSVGVVAQELHDGQQGGGGDVDGELILVDGELLDVFGEDRGEVFTVLVHGCDGGLQFGISLLVDPWSSGGCIHDGHVSEDVGGRVSIHVCLCIVPFSHA